MRRTAADVDFLTVDERLVRVVRSGERVDRDGNAVLEGEPAVAGDVVGMRVRLDCPHDADMAVRGFVEVLLDRVGRVDDHGLPGLLVADQVGGAAEVVVDELAEDHDVEASTGCR